MVIFCVGCTHLPEKEEITLNPGVENEAFYQAFKNRTIKMVGPASGTSSENIAKLRNLNNLCVEAPQDIMTEVLPFHTNTDEKRFEYLKKALYDPCENTVIWTLRGGYGSARLISDLKRLKKPKQEKIFIGYSDITALHLFFSQKWHWKTIHGAAMVDMLNPAKDPNNFLKIAEMVSKEKNVFTLEPLFPLNEAAEHFSKIQGRLTGGNLSVVESSIGSDWQIDSKNKIVFLEDTGEKGYKIDRMLYHLRQAGIFRGVKAVIFGDFVLSDEYLDFALERFAKEINIPVFKSDQFGHGKKNYPLIYNALSEINFNTKTNTLTLEMHLSEKPDATQIPHL